MTEFYITANTFNEEYPLCKEYGAKESNTSQVGRIRFDFDNVQKFIVWLLEQETEESENLAISLCDYHNIEECWLMINDVIYISENGQSNSLSHDDFYNHELTIREDLR